MEQYQHYFDTNRSLWNQRTAVHKESGFYDVPSFLGGKSSLTAIELEHLGDVRGKKILHLQCHFGMDTLSLSRMGATVTGVDLSDAAIEEARRLNEVLEQDARFICCNVYDLPQHLDETFDIVYTSFGVIGWLPDLAPWAALIRRFLKPGGFFFMAEFHPVIWMMDDEMRELRYHYHNHEVIAIDSTGTYSDPDAPIAHKEYGWNHALSEVFTVLLGEGLQLSSFREYSYSPFPCFSRVVQGADGNWRIEGLEDKLPMVYAIRFEG
jgi:SAM-dependent methyltransferase